MVIWKSRSVTSTTRPGVASCVAPPPARERAVRRLGDEHLHLHAATVHFGHRCPFRQRAVRGGRYRRRVLELFRTLRKLLRLDDAVARRALDEARVAEQRLVEAEQRLD